MGNTAMSECKTCNGTGDVEVEDGNVLVLHFCPQCDGTGQSDEPELDTIDLGHELEKRGAQADRDFEAARADWWAE